MVNHVSMVQYVQEKLILGTCDGIIFVLNVLTTELVKVREGNPSCFKVLNVGTPFEGFRVFGSGFSFCNVSSGRASASASRRAHVNVVPRGSG